MSIRSWRRQEGSSPRPLWEHCLRAPPEPAGSTFLLFEATDAVMLGAEAQETQTSLLESASVPNTPVPSRHGPC